MNLLVDVAAELQKEALGANPEAYNQKVKAIREAYEVLDRSMVNQDAVPSATLREAMVLADFPLYFGHVLSRAFLKEYPEQESSWKTYTFADTVPDFRAVDRFRTDEMDTLVRRKELGEVKQTSVSESKISYSVEEYARGYTISWRTLVDDDMGEIKKFPQKLARTVGRFEADYVNALYDNATVKATLSGLGGNYYLDYALSINSLIHAYERFALRTDSKGNPISVAPVYLVTNPVWKLKVQEILGGVDTTLTMPAVPRVTKNLLQWIPDPYMSSTSEWFLFANPGDIPAVTVARMRGYEAPRMYMKAPDMVPIGSNGTGGGSPSWLTGSFAHGEIEFLVQDIIGAWNDATYVGVTDYHGILYSKGTSDL